jgi:hypothetical protein
MLGEGRSLAEVHHRCSHGSNHTEQDAHGKAGWLVCIPQLRSHTHTPRYTHTYIHTHAHTHRTRCDAPEAAAAEGGDGMAFLAGGLHLPLEGQVSGLLARHAYRGGGGGGHV